MTAFPTHRRRGKQKRQSQTLMERLQAGVANNCRRGVQNRRRFSGHRSGIGYRVYHRFLPFGVHYPYYMY